MENKYEDMDQAFLDGKITWQEHAAWEQENPPNPYTIPLIGIVLAIPFVIGMMVFS